MAARPQQQGLRQQLLLGALLAQAICFALGSFGTPAWSYRSSSLPCNETFSVDVRSFDSPMQLRQAAVQIFQACGLVALRNAFPVEEAERLRSETESTLGPALASRQKVRGALKSILLRQQAHSSPSPSPSPSVFFPFPVQDAWAMVADEPLFDLGAVYRERGDGRIDIQMPLPVVTPSDAGRSDPDAREQRVGAARRRTRLLLANRYVTPVLAALLGKDYSMKSLSVMYALPVAHDNGSRVCGEPQHWHRDLPLLFEDESNFHIKGFHSRAGGVQTPPYLLNVFIPLVDVGDENGATAFVLASHTWGG